MTNNRFLKIASVNGELQAIHLQTILEQAGIPCRSRTSRSATRYLDVLVPREQVRDARGLLDPARRAEIFCDPA